MLLKHVNFHSGSLSTIQFFFLWFSQFRPLTFFPHLHESALRVVYSMMFNGAENEKNVEKKTHTHTRAEFILLDIHIQYPYVLRLFIIQYKYRSFTCILLLRLRLNTIESGI